MKTISIGVVLLAGAAVCAQAQQWEFGGVGGGAFLNNVNVSAPPLVPTRTNSLPCLGSSSTTATSCSATAGFGSGVVAGAFFGQNISNHIGGEIRYEFFQSDLKLSSNGNTTTFSGQAHAIHYDLLVHTSSKNTKTQLFGAIGGGMKLFRGTGSESANQPLYQYGYFTKTRQVKPMVDFGVGVKVSLSQHVFLRVEVRDFVTGFPDQVLAPPPGVKYGSTLHDIVPMAGLAYLF